MLGRGAWVWLVAAGLLGCQGQTTDASGSQDLAVRAQSSCVWQSQCLAEFRQQYQTVDRCVALELYRHAEPADCAEANADFKACLSELTCEEFVAVRPTLDALQTHADAGVPTQSLPCEIKLLFYLESCAQWPCANGAIINRQLVCNGQSDCADGSDESGCP
jgi:hypothetical protein